VQILSLQTSNLFLVNMSIPKIIYQTYKDQNIPTLTRFFVQLMKWRNPQYQYEFYDDKRIDAFFLAEYGNEVYKAYKRIDIGAAKADFFRYAVLYKFGGVYLDIDGYTTRNLDELIQPDDAAIITKERNPGIFAQYALVFEKGHPMLKRCLDKILDNIENDKHSNDIHRLTGPTVFTEAVNECIEEGNGKYRIFGVDYNGFLKSKHILHAGLFVKREKWQKAQQKRPALKPR
jgi:mannosyltransferase OCH1-like enzyme